MAEVLRAAWTAIADGFALVAPHLRRIFIGLFLVTAFAGTSTVLLFVITADQLQNSIGSVDTGTVKTSIGAIREDVAAVEHYYKVLDAIAKKQVETEQALFEANVKARTALASLVAITNDIRSRINLQNTQYIVPPLKVAAFQDSATGSDSERALVFDHAVAAYFAQYFAALDNLSGSSATAQARKSLETFKDDIYKQMTAYTATLADYNIQTSYVQSLQGQESALQQQQKNLDEAVAPAGSALAKPAYWNLCEDFYSFKTLVGENAYNIVLLPKMMLVLGLSMFMGILGSLIFISQQFLKDPKTRSFWDILFRIGLGAGVAFALFFFAAAGMLALSQNAGGTSGQAEMSPYLISFLGITGGYLSDRVMDWMRQVGENTFRLDSGKQPPRWAPGLAPALSAAGLGAAAAAASCGVGDSELESWKALAKPVPGDKQPLLAAFLRQHPSTLFTDIAPEGGAALQPPIPASEAGAA